MMEYQTLELIDFSGGITDFPFQAPINKYENLDNIIIDTNKKALQRPGSVPYILDHPELPVTGVRIHNLPSISTPSGIFAAQDDKIYYPDIASWVELQGIGGVPAFNQGQPDMTSAFAEWNGHLFATDSEFSLPIKIFRDNTNTLQLRTAGLPEHPAFTATSAVAGTNSYIYYVVYTYTYNVGNTTFIDVSAPAAYRLDNAQTVASNVATNNTVNIVALANSGGSSYDTGTIKIDIYRTVNGGQVAYFVSSELNSTAGYNDVLDDDTLQTREVLYTSDGVRPNDAPPRAKYITMMNGRAYYAYIQDPNTLEEFPTRVFQSVQDDPDSVPIDFFVDVRDYIKGISSYANNVIVGGTSKMYRIDGYFDEFGRNGMTYEEISKITGVVSHNSFVQTDKGVFFAGNNGFYFTDGYRVSLISKSIPDRYKLIVADPNLAQKIFGVYDPIELRVYWAVPSESSVGENDTIYVLDLRQPIDLDNNDSCLTTWSNDEYFRPSALGFFNRQLIRGDSRGFVFKHDALYPSDPRIDVTAAYLDWGTKAIVYNVQSSHMNFNTPQVRKWVTRVLATFRNLSDLSVEIRSINDDGATESPLKEIRFRNLLTWGAPDPIWGTPTYIWNDTGFIEQFRRFPANGLRCSYKQIKVTNSYTIITRSDDVCTVTIDPVTQIATLDDASFSWNSDLLDLYLNIQGAGPNSDPTEYYWNFPIVDRIDNQNILLGNPSETPSSFPVPTDPADNFNNRNWYIKGIAKTEVMNLMGLLIYFAPIGPSQRTYQSPILDSGENA